MSASIAFFLLSCSLLKVCVGLYVVEVQLFGYNNPTGRCSDPEECVRDDGEHDCCDNPRNYLSCDIQIFQRCDSYFIYCLRSLGSSREGCFNYTNRISFVNRDDREVDFSQNVVLGLENPLVLEGITDKYESEIQVYIEIRDDETNPSLLPDDLVDILLINHSLAVGESTQRQTFNGSAGFVTMDLNITVLCVENFQEPDCTQCVTGFTGPDCQTNIDDCEAEAQNCSERGQCVDGVNSFTCDCSPGYSGTVCEIQDQVSITEAAAGRGSMGAIIAAIAGGVGGGIALLLILVIVGGSLTCVYLSRRHKRKESKSPKEELKESVYVTTAAQTLQSDQLEMKRNEAYVSITQSRYTTIETEDNVCYGQSTSHIHTDT